MSATYKPTTGHKMKAYVNTGTHAVPVWLEIGEIGDLNIADLTRSIAELKRRANGFTKGLASLINMIKADFRLHFGLGRTAYDIIRASFFSGQPYEWAFMNGAIGTSGHQGLTMPAITESFPMDQGLENVAGHDVSLCAAYHEDEVNGGEIDPYWYVVGTTTTTTTTT